MGPVGAAQRWQAESSGGSLKGRQPNAGYLLWPTPENLAASLPLQLFIKMVTKSHACSGEGIQTLPRDDRSKVIKGRVGSGILLWPVLENTICCSHFPLPVLIWVGIEWGIWRHSDESWNSCSTMNWLCDFSRIFQPVRALVSLSQNGNTNTLYDGHLWKINDFGKDPSLIGVQCPFLASWPALSGFHESFMTVGVRATISPQTWGIQSVTPKWVSQKLISDR